MYTFGDGNRGDLVSLRPEGTAGEDAFLHFLSHTIIIMKMSGDKIKSSIASHPIILSWYQVWFVPPLIIIPLRSHNVSSTMGLCSDENGHKKVAIANSPNLEV